MQSMRLGVSAAAYDGSIGRYARELAPRFAAFAGVPALPPGPVLDVGCGPGALSAWLAARVGAAAVSAVDPAEQLAAACRERVPGADVRVASAEALPFPDATFQAALAQLVLAFVSDGPRAAAEMARVVRTGGIVAACMFEPNGLAVTRLFWEAARRFDPAAPDDARLPYRTAEALSALWAGAGLREIRTSGIDLEVDYDGVDDLWTMFTAGVGPAGAYFVRQPEERRGAIRDAYVELLGRPRAGFSLPARAVAVLGRR
jgi:SAM-dependent methyltransferase